MIVSPRLRRLDSRGELGFKSKYNCEMTQQLKLKQTPILRVETENEYEKLVYKDLNEINKTLERILKTFGDVGWLEGEKKERTWDKYSLENLRHIELTESEQNQFEKIQDSILEAHRFMSWSLRDSGWSTKNGTGTEKSALRLKILKVALSHILEIIKNTLPMSSKLYPQGEMTLENSQQSFDLVMWEMTQKVLKSLNSVKAWSEDTDLQLILNLNPDLEIIQKFNVQGRIATTVNGLGLQVVETNLQYEKEFGEQISLTSPTVTTITMESIKSECSYIAGTNIKSLIIQSAYTKSDEGFKKEFLIFVDGELCDEDLKIAGMVPFVFIEGKQYELREKIAQDYFAQYSDRLNYELDKPNNTHHIPILKQEKVEVLGLKFNDEQIATVENYIIGQTQNKADLEVARQKSKDKREVNRQKYTQRK